MTVLFLGNVEIAPESLLRALEPLRRRPPLPIRFARATIFPSRGRPHLVCLPIDEGRNDAVTLMEETRACLERVLAEVTGSPVKTPHVTLARFPKRARAQSRREVASALERVTEDAWRIRDEWSALELLASDLTPAGPRYSVLGTVPFEGSLSTRRVDPQRR